MSSLPPKICPCQPNTAEARRYVDCCQPIHADITLAERPEQLMRARYSAFCLSLSDFLIDSWDAAHCPSRADLEGAGPQWLALEILDSGQDADTGMVRFHATFFEQGKFQRLQELSRFHHDGHHWRYVDGDAEWQTLTPGRNNLCPCGSGKKIKRCCTA
ncbi:zinc chelation protein SecC [Cobetia marina]|uniref:YchJ family protein n=1 Tax=Cobetia marina TaxID=28258 RepID=UPI0010AE38DF|nr:YchJ family metal-binding protein [Cobetia marina]TKD63890.1 zinc chelation protein SecC [Cobetia marina]